MRVTAQFAAIVTVLVLILTVVVGVKLIGTFALSEQESLKDDLTVGQTLAKDLLDSNVDEIKKQEIEVRLEKLRSDIRWSELSLIEQDKWSRIDAALRLRHIQRAQVRDIETRCDAITAAPVSPDGTQKSSLVETHCQ